MPNATLRANARTMPKSQPHPDAEVFDLAKKATDAENVRRAANESLRQVEAQHHDRKWPDALKRTKRDHELGFFAGGDIGSGYEHDEIALIRSLRRRIGHVPIEDGAEAYARAGAILDAWSAWRASEKIENDRLEFATRQAAYCDAADRHEHIMAALAMTPATTVEGLFAKVRGLGFYLMDDEGIGKALRGQIEQCGVDDDAVYVALARDIAALARKAEAAR